MSGCYVVKFVLPSPGPRRAAVGRNLDSVLQLAAAADTGQCIVGRRTDSGGSRWSADELIV